MAGQEGGGMFLNCSHCRLSIQMRSASIQMEHCPRCLARARLLKPLFRSPLPLTALRSAGSEHQGGADRGSRARFDTR